jgi:hypothetical protein
MTTLLLLELFAGFLAAGMALWFVVLSRSSSQVAASNSAATAWLSTPDGGRIGRALGGYFLRDGLLASTGLLLLGPGRFSFDAAIVADLTAEPTSEDLGNCDSGYLVPAFVALAGNDES